MDPSHDTVAMLALWYLLRSRTVPMNYLLDLTLPKQPYIAQNGVEIVT